MFKKLLNLNKLSTLLLYTSILIFIIAFNFRDNPTGGWQQQFMPFINNRPLADITFLDGLTGYAVTGDQTNGDTNYILKTTNSGNNWNIIKSTYKDLTRVIFLNNDTGFVCGGKNDIFGYLIKTTDGGNSWIDLTTPDDIYIRDMSVINEDTIWVVDELFGTYIHKTTNGGNSWVRQLQTGGGLNKIYMYDNNIGFASSSPDTFFKTTNSGNNWLQIPGQNGFNDIYFIDSLNGWKCLDSMRMTTDGGQTWKRQYIPYGGNLSNFGVMQNFSNINADTIWGAGGYITYPGVGITNRAILYMTTNGGTNWAYQIPDTSFRIAQLFLINFISKKIGWSYSYLKEGIHTTSGGDTTFYTGIIQTGNELPAQFELKQNYPNPFNPRTVIPYKIKSPSYVRLTAYDILGKETQRLVDQFQQAGEYEVDFMGKYGASGVYFYRMEVEDNKSGKLFSETKRMMLLK